VTAEMNEIKTETNYLLSREPEYEHLEPDCIRLFRGAGRIRLTVAEDRSYLDVRIIRAFPLSDPDKFIGLLDGKERIIGVLNHLKTANDETRKIIREELERRYFTPTIRKIYSMKEEYGVYYCNVDTTNGKRRFVAKGIRDQLLDISNEQMMITDVDGNRYRVLDWQSLDAKSKRYLEQLV
jgi:hypothetical protein